MPSSDYLEELTAKADAITADEWKITEEISRHLPEKPSTRAELKAALEIRPALQAELAHKTGYTPSQWLLENELTEIKARRDKVDVSAPVVEDDTIYKRAARSGLMGISLSGGGIRSATFSLGILQGLAELRLLHCFDYLASVSGGGYIHQWLAAWGKRKGFRKVAQELVPLPELGSPESHPEPIRWLRRYSNYLTPEKGLFTADTWAMVAAWLRNTLLNQIILVSGLLFLVLLPHILTFPSITPKHGPGAAIAIGAIFYLFLVAAFFLAKNLYHFGGRPTTELGLFGQKGVQLGIVIPLLVSSLLFTLLFPVTSSNLFLVGLLAWSSVSAFLLFILALVIIFWGGAPLCYLQSHHRTAQYKSFGEFWGRPKCRAHLRMVFVIIGLVLAAAFVAICGAAWIYLSDWWVATLWSHSGDYWWRLVVVIDPPLVLIGILLTVILLLGILGRTYEDGRREWIARLGAWVGLYALGWIIAVGVSLFGNTVIQWFGAHFKTMIAALTTWAGTSLGGLLAGKSSKSAGAKDDQAPSGFNLVEIIAIVAPYVFVAGLLLLLSALAEVLLSLVQGHGGWVVFVTFVAPLIICLLFAWRVDINEFSMHAFYRNRLARCYLGASNAGRDANPFSGFDERDAELAVSQLRPQYDYYGPFPIFCTTLNLTFGEDLAWQERKAASFAFTPLYSGYDVAWTAAKGERTDLRFNGFANTATYAYPQPGIHVSTAAAISGAAVSPNFGYHTNPATAFLLTTFNVRLGWWLRNPRAVDENGKRLNLGANRISPEHSFFRGPYPSPSPRSSLMYLINELLGHANDTRKFVYLSDGGHFDNMGLYELVRRRCRYVVICDGEADGELTFEGIGMAIRKCRIDFGVEVTLDLRPLEHVDASGDSSAHCVVGTIRYPEDGPKDEPGIVVYIKSSLTGDEPGDILNYKREHPAFPHDTTLNQWFTESQFESYRKLGHHVAITTFKPASPHALPCATITGRADYFSNLRTIWSAFTPEMKQFSADHSKSYGSLLQEIRADAKLPGLFDLLYDPDPGPKVEWSKTSNADVPYAVGFSSKLIEFIFVIYLQLKLVYPDNLERPFATGWLVIFRRWGKIDVVRQGWDKYGRGYTKGFQIFAHKEIGLPEIKE